MLLQPTKVWQTAIYVGFEHHFIRIFSFSVKIISSLDSEEAATARRSKPARCRRTPATEDHLSQRFPGGHLATFKKGISWANFCAMLFQMLRHECGSYREPPAWRRRARWVYRLPGQCSRWEIWRNQTWFPELIQLADPWPISLRKRTVLSSERHDLASTLSHSSQPNCGPCHLRWPFFITLALVKRVGHLQALSLSASCLEFGPNDCRVVLKPRHGYITLRKSSWLLLYVSRRSYIHLYIHLWLSPLHLSVVLVQVLPHFVSLWLLAVGCVEVKC